ncbi:MAG: DUF2752 domain-containing protein [Verrucomicrobia bacterium]|nr:DUF2752 domain-containing protein [Verrucomicrobiota bacterium]
MRSRALWVLAAVLLVAALLRFGLSDWLPAMCPLRRLTGIPCATCGMTRAAAALSRGELAQASAFNIAAIPLALLLAALMGLFAWEAVTDRAIVGPVWRRCSKPVTWFLVVLLLAAWVVNLHRHFG